MREAARLLKETAKAALECAARNNEPVPAWLLPFLTEDGWRHYEQLRTQTSTWGVTGFSDAVEQEVSTTCLECGSEATHYGAGESASCDAHWYQQS
jgi:hypothetical protein